VKILIISSYYGIAGGGVGLLVESITSQLAKFGQSTVFVGLQDLIRPEVPEGVVAHFINPLHLYPLSAKNVQPAWKKIIWQIWDLYNPSSIKLLREIIQREQPDLIHIGKMRGFSGAIWQVCCEQMPGKVIQTLQDYESISPVGTLEGRIGHWAEKGHWLLWPYQTVRRFHTREISWVTAPSRYTLEAVLERGVFANARTRVIPNPYTWNSAELLTRQQTHVIQKKARGSSLFFLFLGRLEPEKGIRELLAAFSNVSKKYPNLCLWVAGWGTLEDELRRNWGNHPAIKFLGRVQGKQKEKLLEEMDVMVVPSTWPEVFGIVSVEALAFGKPVIASNTGGLPEIIVEGQTGWLFEPGNIQALQDRLECVVLHPQMLDEMSQACYEASKKYAVDMVTREYLKLYEMVIHAAP
jgi:glycosyltransferase involved in cell wall biosynthesis